MKYTIIYFKDKEAHIKKHKHLTKVLKKLNIKPTKKEEEWTDYDIIFYLKQIPLNYGKYTIIDTPFKHQIQNNKNAYIARLPVNAILGYKHMLNLNKLNFYPYSITIRKLKDFSQNDFKKYSYWILKPSLGTYGHNIKIVKKENVKKELEEYTEGIYPIVCQRYITNPLLINGHKFDFRVYVLWIDNKVYVNKNFYTRLAYKKYDYNNPTNLEAGLTNLSQHKILKYLVRGDEFLKRYNKEYPDDNANFKNLEDKIQKLVKEYFVFVKKSINKYLDFWNDKKNHYFNLFGFDILPDENGKLYLLEVNISPGFNDNRKNSLIPIVLEDMIKIILKQKQKSFVEL